MTDTASTRLAEADRKVAYQQFLDRLEPGFSGCSPEFIFDAGWNAALSTAQASGREQIVAWLRRQAEENNRTTEHYQHWAGHFADAIERGDYLATPVEPSPLDTVNGFDGPCPICRCRTFAAVDDEFAPGRFQRCVECKTTLDLAIYKASEPSLVDVERVAKAICAADGLDPDKVIIEIADQQFLLWMNHTHQAAAALAALQSPPVEQPAQAEGGE